MTDSALMLHTSPETSWWRLILHWRYSQVLKQPGDDGFYADFTDKSWNSLVTTDSTLLHTSPETAWWRLILHWRYRYVRETGFQSAQTWACATSSASSLMVSGLGQNRLQTASYLSLFLWHISCLFLWPSHCVNHSQVASFCRHTDTMYPTMIK